MPRCNLQGHLETQSPDPEHSSNPLHGYTHTPQPPHSMKYKINTALSNKQQKENSNFYFNDMRETRKTFWPKVKTEQKQKETETERRVST